MELKISSRATSHQGQRTSINLQVERRRLSASSMISTCQGEMLLDRNLLLSSLGNGQTMTSGMTVQRSCAIRFVTCRSFLQWESLEVVDRSFLPDSNPSSTSSTTLSLLIHKCSTSSKPFVLINSPISSRRLKTWQNHLLSQRLLCSI